MAINTRTGIAIVANQASNSVTLIDLAGPTRLGFICTANAGATLDAITPPPGPSCPASAPTSVAVDNLRNLALVTNSATQTVAVINLATSSVREIIPAGATSIADVPWGVGINPLSGLAIVAYQGAGFASILNLNQVPAVVTGIVRITLDGESAILTAGDMVFVPRGAVRRVEVVGSFPAHCLDAVYAH